MNFGQERRITLGKDPEKNQIWFGTNEKNIGGKNMNDKSERRLTLYERIAKHRAAHPRDKVSFGEERLPKKKKELKRNRKTEKLKPKKPDNQTESAAKAVKPPIRSQLPSNMRRCRKCGTVANAHRVRTGDCHTDSYGKGYRGQDGYSGNNGRGKFHGN